MSERQETQANTQKFSNSNKYKLLHKTQQQMEKQ
jgi:hypothetical protein